MLSAPPPSSVDDSDPALRRHTLNLLTEPGHGGMDLGGQVPLKIRLQPQGGVADLVIMERLVGQLGLVEIRLDPQHL